MRFDNTYIVCRAAPVVVGEQALTNDSTRYESLSKDLASPVVIGESLHKNLPPEIQSILNPHSGLEIKGAETQTVYSFNPLKTAEDLIEGEEIR